MGKLFDGLFDFNGDGETSMSEAILGINMMQENAQSANLQSNLTKDHLPDSTSRIDHDGTLDHQEEVQELQDQVEALNDQLEELEWDEPCDWMSEAHASWEEAYDELKDHIEDLENAIYDSDTFF